MRVDIYYDLIFIGDSILIRLDYFPSEVEITRQKAYDVINLWYPYGSSNNIVVLTNYKLTENFMTFGEHKDFVRRYAKY